MAIVSIERHEVYPSWKCVDGSRVIKRPKPENFVGLVTVFVPDEVVRSKETQPVIDAYAEAVNKPDLYGKSAEQLELEHQLVLGFTVTQFDDGSDPKAWMEAQHTLQEAKGNWKVGGDETDANRNGKPLAHCNNRESE